MSFGGWVGLRRGILEHLVQRRLTIREGMTLTVLIMLADKSTGSSTINVPTLKHYLPELTDDMADRTLRSLQKKGYIYRKITYKSKPAYPYWVAGYEPTVGSLRARRLDLSEVLVTKDISKLRYINPAAEGAAQPADEGAAEPADSNKKREERKQEQTKVLTVIEDGATHISSKRDRAQD